VGSSHSPFHRPGRGQAKTKFLVIDSYHKEYNWSRETHSGFCAAMLKLGYFDREEQVAEYLANDTVESSSAIVKRIWLDAKRKNLKESAGVVRSEVARVVREYEPQLVFLGDDDAAQHTADVLLDAPIPVVFWGIDNTPVKYGLVESEGWPGHNVTGVYQSGYYTESLALLKRIAPG